MRGRCCYTQLDRRVRDASVPRVGISVAVPVVESAIVGGLGFGVGSGEGAAISRVEGAFVAGASVESDTTPKSTTISLPISKHAVVSSPP